MANATKNALKSTSILAAIKVTSKNADAMGAVDKALKAARNIVQTVRESAKVFHDACVRCAEHAREHGDVMPAHRLVMELRAIGHGATDTLSNEIVAWFRTHSSIRWDAKKQPFQAKEGDAGYKPYEEDYSSTESFDDMDQVKRARAAANKAGNATLAEADTKMLMGRIYGLRAWFKRLDEGKDARGLKESEKRSMLKIINAIEEAAVEAAPKKVVEAMEAKAA